jgi:hypothetical protein
VRCAIDNNAGKVDCAAMNQATGMCKVCGCHWSAHENSNKVYHVRKTEESVDIDNLKH